MKKILYCFAVVLGIASCNSWDDELTQNYGDGPAVSIDLVTKTDSTFTFTVTPSSETQFYTYAVVEADEAEEVNASSLLRNTLDAIESAVVEYSEHASVTINMRDSKGLPLCEPNTSYVVYAVAANDKGITGNVVSLEVTTTDGNVPLVERFSTKDSLTTVVFTEDVYAGEGVISAKYYKEWDIMNPIDVETDSIEVTFDENKVGLVAKGVPAGAIVAYSWEEGAIVDSFGNPSPVMNSSFDPEKDEFIGVYIELEKEPWSIEDENITAPEAKSSFINWQDFEGEITFDEKVFVNTTKFKKGDLAVIYTNSSRTVTYQLPLDNIDLGLGEDFSTEKVTFTLPQATQTGDKVTITIKEDVFFDIYGNGNEAYASDSVFWTAQPMTAEYFLGDFSFLYVSYSDGEIYDGGIITIKENPDEENGIIISNIFDTGLDLYGYYDANEWKIYIYDGQEFGTSGLYYCIFGNALDDADIAITVNPDGTMETEDWFGICAFKDKEYEDWAGWLKVAVYSLFTKAESAQASSRVQKAKNWQPRMADFKHTKKTLFRK